MSDLERGSRTRIHNIELGKKWEPVQPAVDKIGSYGLSLDRKTISYLRNRKYKGRLITEQLLAIEQSKQGNASVKYDTYSGVARAGIELRENTPSTLGRYSAMTLIKEIGEAVLESDIVVRGLLRTMRTDLISFDQAIKEDESAKEVRNLFFQTAESYIDAYRNPPSLRPKLVDVLEGEWSYQNIADFYRLLYAKSSTWTIATWTPYEVGVFAYFYDYQAEQEHPHTPFDKFILTKTAENTAANKLVSETQARFYVPVHSPDIRLHRNLLLYGQLRVNRELYESS